MPALVPLEQLKRFLGVADGADDALLTELLDAVEAHLATQCGRAEAPFAAAAIGRVETHDGTGTAHLYLDYPIDAVTEVRVGPDPSAPDETLDPADPAVLRWAAGVARLARTDGGRWRAYGEPLCVRVTYNTRADLPADCALAVERVAAAVYRQLGSEDVRSERTGGYSADLAAVAEGDPLWRAAVGAHGRRRY